jgi:hypothetical protein
MADKTPVKRKKPVSQKRVAVVLASLVGAMTLCSSTLLLMEGGALGTGFPGFAVNPDSFAARLEPAVSLQPSSWNYIIIYESGDLSAGAESLAEGRLTAGGTNTPPRPKANFHFVIDSAESGTGTLDGELEIGRSWINQSTGAPFVGWPDQRYHNSTPYNNAVGICLVGDLNRKPLSEAQHQTLLRLVRSLQHRWNIPKERVLFQSDPERWDPGWGSMPPKPALQAYASGFRANLE